MCQGELFYLHTLQPQIRTYEIAQLALEGFRIKVVREPGKTTHCCPVNMREFKAVARSLGIHYEGDALDKQCEPDEKTPSNGGSSTRV